MAPSTGTLDPDALETALLASGEELATESELAVLLGVSRDWLNSARFAAYTTARPVRFIRSPMTVRYCISDMRAALEARRPYLEAKRQAGIDREAANIAEAKAAAEARREAREAKKKAKVRPKASRRTTRRGMPARVAEVYVVRRRAG